MIATAIGAFTLFAGAGPASAAQRYAAPSGAGVTCTSAQPCTLATALSDAVAGDEVIVGPGTYGPSGANLSSSAANLNVHGAYGQPRPVIESTHAPNGLTLLGSGTELRWLSVHDSVGNGLRFRGQLAEEVVARGDARNAGCVVDSTVLIRDTVCASHGGAGLLATGVNTDSNTITLRNVTAVGTNTGAIGISAISASPSGHGVSVSAFNTIARGTGTDIYVKQDGQPARVTTSHSNWDPAHSASLGGGSIVDDGTVQTAAPAFDAVTGYVETLASPSVDAGTFDLANGTSDVDGNARSIGLGTDIGAAERTIRPTVATGSTSFISPWLATVLGSVTANGLETHYHYDYGKTTSYGQKTPQVDAGSGTAPQSVPVTLPGLTPRTLYHFRLVAVNAIGTTLGADNSLTTGAAGPPPPTATPTGQAPGQKSSSVKPRVVQCIVPRLKGLTKSRATKRLTAANCRRGPIYKRLPRHRSKKPLRLVVVGQSSPPGARLGMGTRISFVLGTVKHKHHHSHKRSRRHHSKHKRSH